MVQLAGLVVEYLITGLVCSIWIVLSLLSLGELDFKLDPTLLLFTPLLYVLGMISDYVGSAVVGKWKEKIESAALVKGNIDVKAFSTHRLNVQLLAYCPDLSKSLEMRASRYRIARGTLVNIPLIGLSSIWLYCVSAVDSISLMPIIIISVLTTLLCVITALMWARFLRHYVRQQVDTVKVLKEMLKRKKIRYLDSD